MHPVYRSTPLYYPRCPRCHCVSRSSHSSITSFTSRRVSLHPYVFHLCIHLIFPIPLGSPFSSPFLITHLSKALHPIQFPQSHSQHCFFLGATKHLYNWLCPSVSRSVGWSVGRSVDPLVGKRIRSTIHTSHLFGLLGLVFKVFS